MVLETDIEKIGQFAKLKTAENIAFQNFLKTQNSENIDEIVHRLNVAITSKIDCTFCGNCCKNLRPIASNEELSIFVKPENIEKFKYLEGFMCKHLDEKKCTIYSKRPAVCRSYPFLHEAKFTTRTYGVLQNYEHCPIVFNVFELIKAELKWKSKFT